MLKVAKYWERENDGIRCLLCPNYCFIVESRGLKAEGRCRKRVNLDNILYATNYGETISLCLDPMEKKPLYHFFHGEKILSLGANSCNLICTFCQNYQSSQLPTKTTFISPEQLLNYSLKNSIRHIAFTYTEPFTWYEYILDVGPLLREHNISVVLVTNGYVNLEPLIELLPFISAMNIDLKAFNDDFYVNLCGGNLNPVLETIKTSVDKVHLEVTLLLIEGVNDNERELKQLFSFIAELNNAIPLHISRYFQRYQLKHEKTSVNRIYEVVLTAKKYLKYVYPGNV